MPEPGSSSAMPGTLAQARHIGDALRAADGERAQPALPHMRHQRGHDVEHHVDGAGEQVVRSPARRRDRAHG